MFCVSQLASAAWAIPSRLLRRPVSNVGSVLVFTSWRSSHHVEMGCTIGERAYKDFTSQKRRRHDFFFGGVSSHVETWGTSELAPFSKSKMQINGQDQHLRQLWVSEHANTLIAFAYAAARWTNLMQNTLACAITRLHDLESRIMAACDAAAIGTRFNQGCCVQVPSASDIQKKLSGPVGALPSPQDLANKAKVNTPNADNLASKVPHHHPPHHSHHHHLPCRPGTSTGSNICLGSSVNKPFSLRIRLALLIVKEAHVSCLCPVDLHCNQPGRGVGVQA